MAGLAVNPGHTMTILQQVPVWVFGLLAALVALGLLQTRTRQVPRRRLLGIGIALTLVTLAGVAQLWRNTPWLGLGLISWGLSCLFVTWAFGQSHEQTRPEHAANSGRLTVPGSWLPLALYMAIFFCKFVVGMLSATAPELLHNVSSAIGISALYGLFSELFNARTMRLLKPRIGPTSTLNSSPPPSHNLL
jgi:hypothetical protein